MGSIAARPYACNRAKPEIDVTIPDAYAKEFTPKAQATIKAAGGRFIAIGGVAGVGAKPVTALQGTPPKRVTIQAWDSYEALKAWYNGADYQAALKIGEKYATFRRLPSRVNRRFNAGREKGPPNGAASSLLKH